MKLSYVLTLSCLVSLYTNAFSYANATEYPNFSSFRCQDPDSGKPQSSIVEFRTVEDHPTEVRPLFENKKNLFLYCAAKPGSCGLVYLWPYQKVGHQVPFDGTDISIYYKPDVEGTQNNCSVQFDTLCSNGSMWGMRQTFTSGDLTSACATDILPHGWRCAHFSKNDITSAQSGYSPTSTSSHIGILRAIFKIKAGQNTGITFGGIVLKQDPPRFIYPGADDYADINLIPGKCPQ